MDNSGVVAYLEQIAKLYGMDKDSKYKASAFHKAAKAIGILTIDLGQLHSQGKLVTVKGVGKSIAAVIAELLETGSSSLLDDLKKSVAEKKLPVLLGIALPLAETITQLLYSIPSIQQVEIGGEVRRRLELCSKIELLVSSENIGDAMRDIARLPILATVIPAGNTCTFILNEGIEIRVYICCKEEFIAQLWSSTGSHEHVTRVLQSLPGNRIPVQVQEEQTIYKAAKLPYIPPELRDGRLEFLNFIPRLIDPTDLRGDLHIHTNSSDGTATIEEMVRAARNKGYQYIAICDHTQSLTIANGLHPERLREQMGKITELNKKLKDFKIFMGAEVNILKDGTIDMPDEILAELDIVIASIHTGFKQDKEQLTARMITAIENPHVDIIAHPTGRLLSRRKPYDIDIERVISAAVRYKTALEINASSDRLDLKPEYIQMAKAAGCKLVIDTDAHDCCDLDDMQYGVSMARRGWLTDEDVINTMTAQQLKQWLNRG